jgi:hypothetical protein
MSLLMEGVLNPDNCQESEGREEERIVSRLLRAGRLHELAHGGGAEPR